MRLTSPAILLTIFVCCSFFGQAMANDTTSPLMEINAYAISPDNQIGKIGTHIRNNRVVLSFHDREARTSHSQNYSVNEVIFSQTESSSLASGEVLRVGDYVSVNIPESSESLDITEATAIMLGVAPESLEPGDVLLQVEALFPDRVLLKTLQDKYDNRYTPRSNELFSYSQIKARVADANILFQVAEDIRELSVNMFDWRINTLNRYENCLRNNVCDFTVKDRQWVNQSMGDFSMFGRVPYQRQMQDLQVSSKEQLLQLMTRQAVQFKLLTGLANADKLVPARPVGPGHSRVMGLRPLDGLDPILFKRDGEYKQAVSEIVTHDIQAVRYLLGGFLRMGAVQEVHLGGLFGQSEACNLNTCQRASHFQDIVKPLYEVFLFELAQTQAYLVYLRGDYNERDFLRAIRKAKREIERTKETVLSYQGDDRLMLLSFATTFERIADELTLEQRQLVRQLLEVESDQQSFWRDLVREVRKPQFWGVMACYGVTIFTPAKFVNLLCHAAGLSVTGHSLFNSLQTTQRLYHMQKLQLIPTEMYSDALTGLLIETALAAVYARATVPDFRDALRNVGPGLTTTPALTQSALAMQRGVVRNRGFRNTIDHMIQTLQKMAGGVLFASGAASEPLIGQFLGGDTVEDWTFQRGSDLFSHRLVSVGFLFSMANGLSFVETLLACERIPELPPGMLSEEDQRRFDEMVALQSQAECLSRPEMEDVLGTTENWLDLLVSRSLGAD